FIKVNCAAIPEPLLESELFGYEGGAFTGSKKEGKMGLLELADGGTFLLDENVEMPLSLQVKLLRVLQDKRVQRIGSTKSKKIDVRVISATNQNLEEKIN
ncbi:sigma 54-interacting transcriptional regulator, partial [Alkalihalophilus pseudofirmus]